MSLQSQQKNVTRSARMPKKAPVISRGLITPLTKSGPQKPSCKEGEITPCTCVWKIQVIVVLFRSHGMNITMKSPPFGRNMFDMFVIYFQPPKKQVKVYSLEVIATIQKMVKLLLDDLINLTSLKTWWNSFFAKRAKKVVKLDLPGSCSLSKSKVMNSELGGGFKYLKVKIDGLPIPKGRWVKGPKTHQYVGTVPCTFPLLYLFFKSPLNLGGLMNLQFDVFTYFSSWVERFNMFNHQPGPGDLARIPTLA